MNRGCPALPPAPAEPLGPQETQWAGPLFSGCQPWTWARLGHWLQGVPHLATSMSLAMWMVTLAQGTSGGQDSDQGGAASEGGVPLECLGTSCP